MEKDINNGRTIGFWIIIVPSILFLAMIVFGQIPSFIHYDFPVSLGLQEPVEVIGEMGVAVNKGIGVADLLISMPLLIIGVAGLWQKKSWGLFSMTGAMAFMAYWPMFCLFWFVFAKGLPDFHFTDYISYAIIYTSFTVYGIWGLFYLYKNRKILVDE